MVWWSRAFVAAGLVALSVLAGCSSPKPASASSSSSATTPAAPAVVARFLASLAAPGNKSVAAPAAAGKPGNLTVAAPKLPVTVTFDASNSSGAIATYAWSFGDNGTSANRKAGHAFQAAGNYTVRLAVADLHNATSNATLRLEVRAPLTGRPLFKVHQEFSGSLPVMNPNSCTSQGVDCNDHAVPIVAADDNGTAALAKHVWINVTGSSSIPAGDMQVFWKSPDGTTLAQTAASGMEFSFDYAGAMPAGDYVLRVRLFTGAQVDYTATVDVAYVSA